MPESTYLNNLLGSQVTVVLQEVLPNVRSPLGGVFARPSGVLNEVSDLGIVVGDAFFPWTSVRTVSPASADATGPVDEE